MAELVRVQVELLQGVIRAKDGCKCFNKLEFNVAVV